METPPGRTVVVVSILLIAAGWAVLFLGWMGAGRQEIETGQLPYVISGGFGGAGLLVLGAAGIVVHAVHRASFRRRQDALELLEAIRALGERIAARDDAAGDEDDLAPRRTTRKRTASRRKRSGAAT